MGAAYGHIIHPYEDQDLTFQELHDLLASTTRGFPNSNFVFEKTDGINLFVSCVGGKTVFARNKGQMKGDDRPDKEAIAQHMSAVPHVMEVIGAAANQIDHGMGNLDPLIKRNVFLEGTMYASVEVIHPTTENLIPYGRALIIVHGFVDQNGNASLGDFDTMHFAAHLAKWKLQFEVLPQQIPVLAEPDRNKVAEALNRLYYMAERSTRIMDWARNQAKSIVIDRMIQDGITLDIDLAVRRIFDGDKSTDLRAIRKEYGDTVAEWLKTMDAASAQIRNQAMADLQEIVLQIGALVIHNSKDLLVQDVQLGKKHLLARMRNSMHDITQTDIAVEKARMYREMNRMRAIGGMAEMAMPTEGLIFDYGSKTYKLTGMFAPMNRLHSIVRFRRKPTSDAVQPVQA